MKLSSEGQAFRTEVRGFLEISLPLDKRFKFNSLEKVTREVIIWWQKVLANKGWLVPAWPVEYGGTGWSLMQHYIFSVECARAGAPAISGFGTALVGPVIFNYGNNEQKDRFLPGITSGEKLWCQGYSEPGSGSDLASLKTRAVRDGDHYIVNGQKTWTTQAHWADYIFCLVRTDPGVKKQMGISFLLIDINSPGIEIRPIATIDSKHRHINEVYLTDVRVPVENRIGEENRGWTYAKYLLGNERMANSNTETIRTELNELRELAEAANGYTTAMFSELDFASRYASLETRLAALEMTELRALDADDGSLQLANLSLPLKLIGTELLQDVSQLAIEFLAYNGMPQQFDPPFNTSTGEINLFEAGPDIMRLSIFGRASTIYGGSSEIQRNIMAKAVLGL